jgi:hypothetical protein
MARSLPVSEMLSTGPVKAARVTWAWPTTVRTGVLMVTRRSPTCFTNGSPAAASTAWIWAASRSAAARVSRRGSG